MSARALNLLHHPRAPSVWDGGIAVALLGGLLCGLALGWWAMSGVRAMHAQWDRQHGEDLQRWTALTAQQAQHRALQERARAWARQQAHWRSLQDQQQRLQALQTALQHEAEQGMRLQSWQADGQRQVLQGQSLQPQDWPQLQARLGQALGQSWRLRSLGSGSGGHGMAWVLEAPWASASAAGAAP